MKKLGVLFTTVIMIMLVALSASANDNPHKLGDIIQFGSYPQTEVKDESLTCELNALAPTWDNWTSYGYYSGENSNGTMVQGDWMRYIDINYHGNKYRGVKFTQYRPYYTPYDSSTAYTYQDDNGYSTNVVYWFIFESIDWRVLDPETGLVMCETIIDSQPYSNTIYTNGTGAYSCFNDASFTTYASDYVTSSIRKWLNEDFYNTAFTDSEMKEISTTTLNNDGRFTLDGYAGYEILDSKETKDKIFLLSYNEVGNSNFGFDSTSSANDSARRAQGSDYAQSQGLYVNSYSDSIFNGNSYWLLRSPFRYSNNCCSVDFYGNTVGFCNVSSASNGIRPALIFNDISDIAQSEHQHNYNLVEIAPTCISAGTKTYTCTCGDTYTETIPATNHKNATTDAGKAPTATEVGYTAGKYCPDCETWLEGHEEIPMLHVHSYTPTITREPTCVILGLTTYTCSCGDSYTETMPVLSHEYYYKLEKSTLTKGGALHRICKNCNGTKNVEIYPLVNGFRLSDYEYTYNGKVKTPTVTVKDETGLILVENKDYTVKYESGRKNPGKYTVTVTLIGNYEGEKKLEFSILPGKTSSITATQSTDSIKLTWKKVTGADGYRVYQYNSSTGKYKAIKTLTGTSYTVKKLKAGTTYKFAVKAYSKADGETLWASSYKTITTATKPATPTLKATAGSKQATISWKKVTGATGYVVYMQDEFGDYKKIGSTKKTSYSVKNLEYGETCRFRVVAYKKVDGKNIYGGYKTVKITVPYPAIYVTPTGKRYHFDKECAGKNAIKTTYANAIKGRTPCKTCVL